MFLLVKTKESSGSGDCEVAAERGLAATEAVQFDSEMAGPVLRNVDPNWHRSGLLHQECEWKQGVPAARSESAKARAHLACSTLRVARLQNPLRERKTRGSYCLPLVGKRRNGRHDPKIGVVLDTTRPSHGSRDC